MKEIWRAIVGYEGLYEVSNQGRIRRIGKDHIGRKRYLNHILKDGNCKGYRHIVLHKHKIRETRLVHGLVTSAFLGPRPKGKYVNHKNLDKTDNRLENLEYVTASENYRHALANGHKPPHGSQHHASKLTEDDVREMRDLRKQGWKQRALAERYGVNPPTISRIVNRLWWKHI